MLRHWDERTLDDLLAEHGLTGLPEEPFPNDGWSGATLTQIRRGDGTFILKRTSWAHDWIARHSPARAETWYRGLFEAIETLKTLPTRCPVISESPALGEDVRELLYGKRRGVYRIIFSIRGDVIRILSIWHGARGAWKP